MTSSLIRHKPSTKPEDGASMDQGASTGFGMTGYWIFTGKGSTERDTARRNHLSLGTGIRRTIAAGMRGVTGFAGTSSFATTGVTPGRMGVDGASRRTFICKFMARSPSSASNQGGLITMGTPGDRTLFTVRQCNDPPPDDGPDQWCVDYTGGSPAPLKFIVPRTAGRVHTIAVTYDGANLTVYTDGSFNVTQTVALNTNDNATVDLMHSNRPPVQQPGSLMWLDMGMPIEQWPLGLAGTLMWLEMGMPIEQWPTNDVGSNYFDGTLFEAGLGGIDWDAKRVREWSASSTRLLRDRRALFFSSPLGSTLTVSVPSIARGGGIGATSIAGQAAILSAPAIPPGGGIGVPQIGTVLQLQVMSAPGIGPTGGIGDASIVRAPVWTSTPVADGSWTPTPTAPPSG